MAATPIQKIPTLTGEAAKRFIERADSTERPTLSISEQQRKMYDALSEKTNKNNLLFVELSSFGTRFILLY
nr:hypothetical protein [Leptospira interrogans]